MIPTPPVRKEQSLSDRTPLQPLTCGPGKRIPTAVESPAQASGPYPGPSTGWAQPLPSGTLITCHSSGEGHQTLHRGDPFTGNHRHWIGVKLPDQGDHQSSLSKRQSWLGLLRPFCERLLLSWVRWFHIHLPAVYRRRCWQPISFWLAVLFLIWLQVRRNKTSAIIQRAETTRAVLLGTFSSAVYKNDKSESAFAPLHDSNEANFRLAGDSSCSPWESECTRRRHFLRQGWCVSLLWQKQKQHTSGVEVKKTNVLVRIHTAGMTEDIL